MIDFTSCDFEASSSTFRTKDWCGREWNKALGWVRSSNGMKASASAFKIGDLISIKGLQMLTPRLRRIVGRGDFFRFSNIEDQHFSDRFWLFPETPMYLKTWEKPFLITSDHSKMSIVCIPGFQANYSRRSFRLDWASTQSTKWNFRNEQSIGIGNLSGSGS